MKKEIKQIIRFPESEISKVVSNVTNVCRSGRFSLGPYTEYVESKFLKDRKCLTVSNGTTALELILSVTMMKYYRVVVPALTVPMIRWAANRAGCEVKRVDVNRYHCIDLKIIKALGIKNCAMVYVATGGIVGKDFINLSRYCKDNKIFLILDMSHAHDAKINGDSLWMYADAAYWSFYGTKAMTCGEGGIVYFNNDDLLNRATMFANQGKKRDSGIYESRGYNLRMSEFAACALAAEIDFRQIKLNKLKRIDKWYSDYGIKALHHEIPGLEVSYYKYIVNTKEGQAGFVEQQMRNNDIYCTGRVHSNNDDMDGVFGNFPMTAKISTSHVCLPIYPDMTKVEVKKVTETFKKIGMEE